MSRTILPLAVCWIAAAWPAASAADVFVLAGEGQVEGELLNPRESPRQSFIVRTPSGITVALDKDQVRQIIPQSPAEVEYEKLRPRYPNTVEAQWELAEWCRENSLSRQRETHLENVLRLDPDHREARLAMGYQQIDGRWVQRDQWMQERGYVRYRGQWRLPQEVELLERRRQEDLAQREWTQRLRRWRQDLEGPPDKAHRARDSIRQIADPYAVPALTAALAAERVRLVKLWYIEALARIATPDALRTLVDYSLDDPDVEIRVACLQRLIDGNHREVAPTYVQALKSKDNVRVNRAALALGKLQDKSTISPLIDALITTHRYKIVSGSPGQMSTTFSSDGGGGLSMGGGPKIVKQNVANQEVLDALVALTGVNFEYDVKAWRAWHATQRQPATIDARRD
jgi:hypothetical protein